MKTNLKSLAFAAIAVLLMPACHKSERNTEPLVDPWTREKTLVSFRLESQIGAATISSDWKTDDEGTVHVRLKLSGLNLSQVRVEAIGFKFPDSEFCPTASINVGDAIDLSGGTASFTVTAYNGEERVYTVSYEPFVEPLEGTYIHHKIPGPLDASTRSSMIIIGGYDDNIVMSSDQDKSWHWGSGYQPLDEQDNTVSFMLTDVNSDTGYIRGTLVNLAGDDSKYANYIYRNETDVNAFYRIIPVGSSRWEKDPDGNIHIYAKEDEDYENELYVVKFLDAGSYTISTKSVNVEKCAFMREHAGPYDNYSDTGDGRWLRNNIRNTFWMMEKKSDSPVANHATLF